MTHHIPEGLPDRIRHYIDGEFVDSVGGETFDVLDPVSNETYVQAAAGQKADIEKRQVAGDDEPVGVRPPRMGTTDTVGTAQTAGVGVPIRADPTRRPGLQERVHPRHRLRVGLPGSFSDASGHRL